MSDSASKASATRRRDLLLAPAALALVAAAPVRTRNAKGKDPWAEARAIEARIRPPRIPRRDFRIGDYGARGGGRDDSAAIGKAVAAASAAGGGRVVVPPGVWLTGPVHLKSRVELHVAKGATLKFVQDPTAYFPPVLTRNEGLEFMGISPFIYALDQQDIAVTGEGVLDGQADKDHWWNWVRRQPGVVSDRRRAEDMAEAGVPVAQRVFGPGSTIRPQFIQPYRCKNVLIEGLTIVNSPMWEIHPVACENVIVRGLKIHSRGPNNDGCDPESCRDVLIENCVFDTGDDCIAIKSGRNADGRRLNRPTENVIVRGCTMMDGHGGVTLGSEITGGVRNVFVENCRMDSPRLDYAIRFKNNAMRGGVLENIYVRDVTVGQVAKAVVTVDYNYQEGAKGPYHPVFRNLLIERLSCAKAPRALDLQGFPADPIRDVRLVDCRFDGVAQPSTVVQVEGLSLRGVRVNGKLVSAETIAAAV